MTSQLFNVSDIPLTPRDPNCVVPLTPELTLWWKSLQEDCVSHLRFAAGSVRVVGPLDISLIRQSLQEVAQKHEALRTRIVPLDGTATQQIDAICDVDLQFIDLSGATSVGNEIERICQKFLCEKINLSRDPVFTVQLVRLSGQEHLLLLGIDHFVSDLSSASIVSRDIWNSYSQAVRRIKLLPTRAPIQFGDYAVWQQKLDSVWKQRHEAYWIQRLDKLSCVELPSGYGVGGLTEPEVLLIDIPFAKDLITRLGEVSLKTHVPLSLVTLAVFVILLASWCNERDLLVTLRLHGRDIYKGLEETCGSLATSIYLRIQLPTNATFIDVINIVHLEYLSSRRHMDFSRLEAIIPGLKSPLHFNWMYTKLAHRPARRIEQHAGPLVVEPFAIKRTRFPGGVSPWRGFQVGAVPCNFDSRNGLIMTFWYQNTEFSTEFMQTVGHNLRLFARELADHPGSSISALTFRT